MAAGGIRATAAETIFFADSTGPLLDWLVQSHGMERQPPATLGRHAAILRAEGMELIVDPPAHSMSNSWQVACYGRDKLTLARRINDFARGDLNVAVVVGAGEALGHGPGVAGTGSPNPAPTSPPKAPLRKRQRSSIETSHTTPATSVSVT